MATAREVIAEAYREGEKRTFPLDEEYCEKQADAAIAALRAEDLVIVAAADVRAALSIIDRHTGSDPSPLTDRLDAALAAGGE